MQELILCRGIPASGKSTYSEAWVKAGKRRMRVSRDEIRILLFARYTHENESLVTEVEDAMIATGLMNGYSVIVDDCNIKHSYMKRMAKYAHALRVPVRVKEFPISLDTALIRNALRQGHKRIPEDVIVRMHQGLESSGAVDLPEYLPAL